MFLTRGIFGIALCLGTFALAAKIENRNSGILVVGGENATKNEFPWLVRFEVGVAEGEPRFCLGTLIGLDMVLTSASCVVDSTAGSITVVAGDYLLLEEEDSEQDVKSQEIIVHENFNSGGKLEDNIAIIILASSFEETDAVRAIQLPPAIFDPESSKHGIAVGWGEFDASYNETNPGSMSPILLKAEVTIHNTFACKAIPNSNFPPKTFCTYDTNVTVGAFHGDIGGPLVCKDFEHAVCGILSSTFKNGITSLVGGYIEVSLYLDWIEEKTGIIQPSTVATTARTTTPTTTTIPTTTTTRPTTTRTTTPTTTSPSTPSQSTDEPATTTTTSSATTPSTTSTGGDDNTTPNPSSSTVSSGYSAFARLSPVLSIVLLLSVLLTNFEC